MDRQWKYIKADKSIRAEQRESTRKSLDWSVEVVTPLKYANTKGAKIALGSMKVYSLDYGRKE